MGERETSEQRVLVTGASGGIGYELAREFARKGHPVVLAARTESKLHELAEEIRRECAREAVVIPIDLADRDGPFELAAALETRGLDVHVLVNNAGVLEMGAFTEMTSEAALGMVQLNVSALTALCSLLVPPMVARGYGRILNVASVAAFQPVPSLAVYAASKAFVLSLTEALAEELRGAGVSVTALCPGVTDTPMVQGATAGKSGASMLAMPKALVMAPADVAREGYQACMAGEVIRVPGAAMRLVTGWIQAQRDLVRTLTGAMTRRTL